MLVPSTPAGGDVHTLCPNIFDGRYENVFDRQSVRWDGVLKDLLAAVLGALVGIPLSVAFAVASGYRPDAGIASDVIGGLITGAFGGSKYSVVGPAAGFVSFLHAESSAGHQAAVATASILAAPLLVILALCGCGSKVHEVPRSLTVGLTLGIALATFSSSLRDGLGISPGLRLASLRPADVNPYCAFVFCVTIATSLILSKASKRVPAPLVAILLGCILVKFFIPSDAGLLTLQQKFGHLTLNFVTEDYSSGSGSGSGGEPQQLSDWLHVCYCTATVVAVAGMNGLLTAGLADSLSKSLLSSSRSSSPDSSAQVSPRVSPVLAPRRGSPRTSPGLLPMITPRTPGGGLPDDNFALKSKLRQSPWSPDKELFLQGVISLAAPLVGGFPSTGVASRTALNVSAGALSPLSGLLRSVLVTFLVYIFSSLVDNIPICTIAGVGGYSAIAMTPFTETIALLGRGGRPALLLCITFVSFVAMDFLACILIAFSCHQTMQMVGSEVNIFGFAACKHSTMVLVMLSTLGSLLVFTLGSEYGSMVMVATTTSTNSHQTVWSYGTDRGQLDQFEGAIVMLQPSKWHHKYPQCAGFSQSPINLEAASSAPTADFSASDGPLSLQSSRWSGGQLNVTLRKESYVWHLQPQHHASSTVIPSAAEILRGDPVSSSSSVKYAGVWYSLADVHVHSPSEHTVDGKRFDAEMHLVYKEDASATSSQRLFVAGLLLTGVGLPSAASSERSSPEILRGVTDSVVNAEVGPAVPFVKAFIDAFVDAEQRQSLPPTTASAAGPAPLSLGTSIIASHLHPHAFAFEQRDQEGSERGGQWFTYSGSLTTPPCTEGVQWAVRAKPVPVTFTDISRLTSSQGHEWTARPTQKLQGRHATLITV